MRTLKESVKQYIKLIDTPGFEDGEITAPFKNWPAGTDCEDIKRDFDRCCPISYDQLALLVQQLGELDLLEHLDK